MAIRHWADDCALWGQLNLQEHDPAHIDVGWWKDYWRRTHIDGVTLNASGIVHYYPTDQPHAWVSPWLGGRDLFGELVKAAKELNLRVLARFTPSRVHEELAQSHPDWCMADPDGQPRPDPGHDPGSSRKMYHMCMNGPYYRWWIPEVMFKELMDRYDVDGFFFNAWQTPERTIQVVDIGAKGTLTLGPCHCRTCRRLFREATGHDVPREPTWSDLVWLRWLEWHNDRMDDLAAQYRKAAKSLKPTATVVLNLGADLEGMSHSGHWRKLAEVHDMIDHDHQSRHGPIWSIGMTGRLMRASFHPKPYYHLFGAYGGMGRITGQPAAEHTLMISEMIASGSRLWYHVIGANGEDRRPFETVEKMFGFYHRNREYFLHAESAAEVAIVFSKFATDQYGKDQAARLCGDPYRGAAHALVRARIPFDLLAAEDLTADAKGLGLVNRYRALLLPNLACLSDGQCEALRTFVRNGGGLVATFETSRFTEKAERRDDFALGHLFGVKALADVPLGPYDRAYLRLEEHDLLGLGLEGTNAVSGTVPFYLCPIDVASDARVHLTLIPPIPNMPPERAYFHVQRTDTALAVSRTEGKGRVVYFPCDIDRWCGTNPKGSPHNNPDHRQLLANAVRWVLNGPTMLEVSGSGLVDVFIYRQAARRGSRFIVHLVNCTNPDNWTPPATEITPIGPLSIALRSDRPVTGGRLLWADRKLERSEVVRLDDVTRITVPRIEAYEVVVCEVA